MLTKTIYLWKEKWIQIKITIYTKSSHSLKWGAGAKKGFLMFDFFELIGSAFSSALFVMSGCLAIYFFQRKAQIVDIGWCLTFLLIGVFYFILGNGDLLRRVLLLVVISLWYLRLLWTLRNRFSKEDPRYTELISKWGDGNLLLKVAALFFFQGFLAVILSIPFLLIATNNQPFSSFEVIGLVVWVLGFAFEAWSDQTLNEFKTYSDLVCKEGLWRYSRHPNYFFEWVMWIGVALAAYPTRFGIFGLISPILMYYLLRYVSGVPLAEKQSLQSKGEEYKEYQRETSEFFPWFNKE